MKTLLFPGLALLLIFRLESLKSARERAADIASAPLALTIGRRVPSMTVEGSPMPDSLGRWRLEDPKIGGEPFAGEVVVDAEVLGADPGFGRRVAVTGPFRPAIVARNPGRVADGLDLFRPPRLTGSGRRFRARLLAEPASLLSRVPFEFGRWRARAFARTPGLLGLEDVIWAGDDRKLDARLRAFYREGGLFHLIALSGARVAVLVTLLSLMPFGRWWRPLLPAIACAVLWVTSGGAAPVRRMFPMTIAFLILRWRRWDASRAQCVGTAVALSIAIDPTLISRAGFFLSAVGTALLLQFVSGMGGRSYFVVVSVMPLLMFPLTAFFWAKIGLLAPLYCLCLTWLWDFILVPLGFLLPLVTPFVSLGALEWLWRVIAEFQLAIATHVGTSYASVIRPTILELFAFILAIAFWRNAR